MAGSVDARCAGLSGEVCMPSSRREFLKATGVALGAAALPPWVVELEAAEAAAVDKGRLAEVALSAAKALGASYVDIRVNRYRTESVFTSEKQVPKVHSGPNLRCGVRVLVT